MNRASWTRADHLAGVPSKFREDLYVLLSELCERNYQAGLLDPQRRQKPAIDEEAMQKEIAQLRAEVASKGLQVGKLNNALRASAAVANAPGTGGRFLHKKKARRLCKAALSFVRNSRDPISQAALFAAAEVYALASISTSEFRKQRCAEPLPDPAKALLEIEHLACSSEDESEDIAAIRTVAERALGRTTHASSVDESNKPGEST